MSWSVNATGQGPAFVTELTRQFDQAAGYCASIPQEQETVLKVKDAVLAAVKDGRQVTSVYASGSAYRVGEELQYNTFTVNMTTHPQLFVGDDTPKESVT